MQRLYLQNEILETGRIILRELEEGDIDELAAIASIRIIEKLGTNFEKEDEFRGIKLLMFSKDKPWLNK